MSELTTEQEGRIKSELKTFVQDFTTVSETEATKKKYRKQLVDIAYDSEKRSLIVDYSDLALENPDIARELYSNPKRILGLFNRALRENLETVNEDLEGPEIRKHRVRIKGVKRKVSIRDLFRADLIGKLITFKGIVVKATKVRPRLTRAIFKCKSCGEEFAHSFTSGFFHKPRVCPANDCDNTRSFKMLKQDREFDEFQTLTIQESPEDVPPGELPQSISVRVKGDLAGNARPGERVSIFGILDVYPKKKLREGVNPLFNVFIDCSYIQSEERGEEEVNLTPAEKEKIKELKDDPDLEEKIIKSIAPSIYGYNQIKKSIAASLFGGVHKELADGTELRDTINVLLLGDPGTGKSQILKYTAKVSPRGLYTSGKGSSAAGLTAAVVKTENEWSLEAGALILADKGIACLAEGSRVLVEDKLIPIETLFDENNAFSVISGEEKAKISELDADICALTSKLNTTKDSTIRVRRKKHSGSILNIQLASGFNIKLTPNHKLLDGNTLEWKKASSFEKGEPVIAPFRLPEVEEDIYLLDIIPDDWLIFLNKEEKEKLKAQVIERYESLMEFNKEIGFDKEVLSGGTQPKAGELKNALRELGNYEQWKQKPLKFGRVKAGERLKVATITPKLAYFMGFLFGDGSVCVSKRRSQVSITQSPTNQAQIEQLKDAFRQFSMKKLKANQRETKSVIKGQKVKSKRVDLYTGSNLLAYIYQYLTKNEFRNLLQLPNRSLSAFIAGCIDADGCVSIKHSDANDERTYKVAHVTFQISNCLDECKAFMLALRRFNCYSRLIRGAKVNRIRITGRQDVQRLIEAIDTFSVKAKEIPKRRHKVSSDSGKVPAEPVAKLCDQIITKSNTSQLVENGTGSTIYNYKGRKYQPSRTQLHKSRERANLDVEETEMHKKMENLLSEDYFLDQIQNISKEGYDGYVYDLYVPERHNFVAEGIFVHNCIDEFDKMSRKDRRSLHEAMEQLTVSIAKAGIVATLNARTSILAAANPKFGRYLPDREISENIDLPMTILSRFDLIFIVRDIPNKERDKTMASHILGLHSKDHRPSPVFSPEFLKKYVRYAKDHITPTFTKEAHEKLLEFYLQLRESSKRGSGMGPIAITVRQLEALVRISEAHSRMLLREEVRKDSAEFAIELMKKSLFQVAQESGSEKLDIDKISSTGISHEKRARYTVVLDIIGNKEEEYDEGVPLKVIVEEAEKKEIDEPFVKEILKREKKRGGVYEPSRNKYKLVPS